jgi:hypothetical protein
MVEISGVVLCSASKNGIAAWRSALAEEGSEVPPAGKEIGAAARLALPSGPVFAGFAA